MQHFRGSAWRSLGLRFSSSSVAARVEGEMRTNDDARVLDGVKLQRSGVRRIFGFFQGRMSRPKGPTYSVIGESAPDRRRESRRRVHLRSGKILAESERFLVDCSVRNQSRFGLQLRLAARIALPKEILFYDDSGDTLVRAEIIWRRGEMVGCRIVSSSVERGGELARKLRKPFYAVR